jgi:hypothetical protein
MKDTARCGRTRASSSPLPSYGKALLFNCRSLRPVLEARRLIGSGQGTANARQIRGSTPVRLMVSLILEWSALIVFNRAARLLADFDRTLRVELRADSARAD